MPVTSIRTPRADVDAPFAPSINVFSSRDTCIAAVVIPIIEAETDRGSIFGETLLCSKEKDLKDEDAREEICRQETGKDASAASKPPTLRPFWGRSSFFQQTSPIAETSSLQICRLTALIGSQCFNVHHSNTSF